jgi:hypothetical protein
MFKIKNKKTTLSHLKSQKTIKSNNIEDFLDTGAVPIIEYNKNEKSPEDVEMIVRMTLRTNRKKFILYPEDKLKNSWDLFMTVILLFTCIETPYDIAFASNEIVFNLVNTIIDLMFLMDILVIFNSAFYSDDMDIVEKRGEISIVYL